MTASVLTEQCTRTVDGVYRPVGHRKGLLWCPLPLLSPLQVVHLGTRTCGERKYPELVGACDRYLKGLL